MDVFHPGSVAWFQRPYPNVAEPYRRAVLLKHDGAGHFMGVITRQLFMHGSPKHGRVILHQHAVPKHREESGLEQFVALKSRGTEDDIKSLPFAGLSRSIYERRGLSIDRARDAVGINVAIVRFDDLKFILAEEVDSAISPIHGIAVGLDGCGPVDMKLTIAEFLFRDKLAGFENVDTAVFYSIDAAALPLRKILAIE